MWGISWLADWYTDAYWLAFQSLLGQHFQLRQRNTQYAMSLRGNTVLPSVGGLRELSHWNGKFLLEHNHELIQRLLEIPAAQLHSVTFPQLCAFRLVHVFYRSVHLWFCMLLTGYAIDLPDMLRFGCVLVKRKMGVGQGCALKRVWLTKTRQVEQDSWKFSSKCCMNHSNTASVIFVRLVILACWAGRILCVLGILTWKKHLEAMK